MLAGKRAHRLLGGPHRFLVGLGALDCPAAGREGLLVVGVDFHLRAGELTLIG